MMKKRLIFTLLLALLTCSCMFGACDCLGRNPNLPNLATPNITLNQDVAVWDLDPNAIGYKVSLNGIITRVDSSTTSYQLSLGDEIRVQALADGKAFNNSDWSTTLTYGSGSLEQEAIPYDDTEVRFQSIGTSYYENENGIRSAQITVETYSSAEIAYDKLELVVVGGGVEYTNVNFTGKDTIVELKNNTTYIPKVYFYLNDKLYYLSFTMKTPPLEESIEFGVANSYTFKTDSVLGFDLTLYEHTPNIKDLTVKVWGEDSSNYKTYSVFTNGFVAQDTYYLLIEDAANIAFEDSLYYSITATVDKNDGSDIKEITVVEEDFVYLENLNNVNASVTLTEIADGEYEILVENDTYGLEQAKLGYYDILLTNVETGDVQVLKTSSAPTYSQEDWVNSFIQYLKQDIAIPSVDVIMEQMGCNYLMDFSYHWDLNYLQDYQQNSTQLNIAHLGWRELLLDFCNIVPNGSTQEDVLNNVLNVILQYDSGYMQDLISALSSNLEKVTALANGIKNSHLSYVLNEVFSMDYYLLYEEDYDTYTQYANLLNTYYENGKITLRSTIGEFYTIYYRKNLVSIGASCPSVYQTETFVLDKTMLSAGEYYLTVGFRKVGVEYEDGVYETETYSDNFIIS